jgi:methylmalonyl-CoA mutase
MTSAKTPTDNGRALAERELKAQSDTLIWKTPEGIAVKPLYSAADREAMGEAQNLPGLFPFARGARVSLISGNTARSSAG